MDNICSRYTWLLLLLIMGILFSGCSKKDNVQENHVEKGENGRVNTSEQTQIETNDVDSLSADEHLSSLESSPSISLIPEKMELETQDDKTIKESSLETEKNATVIVARFDETGGAYIPLMDGTCIKIEDNVEKAIVTADRNTLVVLRKDGEIYFTDVNQKNKTEIAKNASGIDGIRDEGFIYTDKEKKTYRVFYSDGKRVLLGTNIDSQVLADKTTSVLYATEGLVYTMAYNSSEACIIGEYKGKFWPTAISNDGNLSVWSDTTDDKMMALFLNEGSEKTTLGNLKIEESGDEWNIGDYWYTYVNFSLDQKCITVGQAFSDTMWVKFEGEDVRTIKLGSNLGFTHVNVYTSNGTLNERNAKDIDSIYILINTAPRTSHAYNIYNINFAGDRERVVSKARSVYFAEDKILYTDENNTLFSATLNGAELIENKEIAQKTWAHLMSANRKYIYYLQNYDYRTGGDLYVYKLGDSNPKKVTSGIGVDSFLGSVEGDTVYYLKDIEDINNSYYQMGTLMKWEYSTEEEKRISSDVVLSYHGFLKSGLKNGVIKETGFMFQKYVEFNENGSLLYDWFYYDGEKISKIAPGIVFSYSDV